MAAQSIIWMISIAIIARVVDTRIDETAPTRAIPKTSFSCRGRGSGYYADTETDCQVYHMCDEQGRQFDYSCPNTTLFQQRMLVCDHWYMVDCSSSEANYGFNSLIGQRDQQFVSQVDAEKRTPRPDLLDRPYAPDYKGESYRNQIGKSNFPALLNSIISFTKNVDKKYEILETQASTNVLPARISSNDLDPTLIPSSEQPQVDKSNERRNAYSAESQETSGKRMSPPPTGFDPPRLLPSYNQEFRNREESRLKQLRLPLQQQQSRSPQAAASTQTTKKPAARTFDPDKNFKAFEHIFQPGKKATHKDYDFSRYFTKKEGQATAAPAQRRQDFKQPVAKQQNQVATAKPVAFNQRTQPTQRTFAPITQRTFAPITQRTFAPITQRTFAPTTQRTVAPTQRTFAPITQRTFAPITQRTFAPITQRTFAPQTQRTFAPTTRQTTRPTQTTTTRRTTPKPVRNNQQFNQNQQFNKPSAPRVNSVPFSKTSKPAVPARDLLPPIDATRNYENYATTKGPSIYNEWKVPERGLLPPKFGNETEEVQSKRSINNQEGNFGVNNDFQRSESRRLNNKTTNKIQYKDLQRLFSIPETQLPIEKSGRDGYENAEALNSFQVKIPYKKDQSDRYYYLEHGHCNPECHPYFFKPGRCEPCIKL